MHCLHGSARLSLEHGRYRLHSMAALLNLEDLIEESKRDDTKRNDQRDNQCISRTVG